MSRGLPCRVSAAFAPALCFAVTLTSGCGQSCKAVGLEGPFVRIVVPKASVDEATTFRVCADTECRDAVVPTWDGADYSVILVVNDADWGRSVRLTLVGSGDSNVDATATIPTHAFYPGCVDTPIATARYDAATGQLEATHYSFDDPQG
jgi:hypothetical protein